MRSIHVHCFFSFPKNLPKYLNRLLISPNDLIDILVPRPLQRLLRNQAAVSRAVASGDSQQCVVVEFFLDCHFAIFFKSAIKS